MALRQTLPIREVLRGCRISWVDVVVGVAIIVVLYVVVRLGQGLSVNFTPGRAPVVISTDISNVPYYAARSLLRMFIALALSTVFALAYGTAVAPLPDCTKATGVDLPTSSASGLTPSHPQSPPEGAGPFDVRDDFGDNLQPLRRIARRTLDRRMAIKPKCSFCGKDQDNVRLVAGPTPKVTICEECVQLCCDIFWPDEAFPWSAPRKADL